MFPEVDTLGYTGKIFIPTSLNSSCVECADYGCTALESPGQLKSIALIQRSQPFDESSPTKAHCTFERKVRNAQTAGFGAVIIYNHPGDDELEAMQGDGNSTDINISAVFIGGSDGESLRVRIGVDGLTGLATLYPDPIFHNFLITFVIVVASSSIVFTIFLFYRRHMMMSTVPYKRMSKRQITRLPKRRFQQGDEEETCVICLDNFESGDTITPLPCKHIFHKKCIIPWLSEQQRVCPICKRDPMEVPTETTPLLEDGRRDEEDYPTVVLGATSSTSLASALSPSPTLMTSNEASLSSSSSSESDEVVDVDLNTPDEVVVVSTTQSINN